MFNRSYAGLLLSVAAATCGGVSATAQSIELEITGEVFGQGVSNGLDLNALVATYPVGTPINLSLTIDRLGPTQGQVTSLSGTLDGGAIDLFDFSTVPDLPPSFVPNVVDLINDGTTGSNFSGDILEIAVDVDGPSVFGLPLTFFTLDLIDTTGTVFGAGQVDLFTDDINVDAFSNSPALGFLQFSDPEGGFSSPRANISFTIESVTSQLFGDYNADGFVSQADLDLVLLNWGESSIPNEWVATDQFDGFFVSQNELDQVLLNWGNGAPPSLANAGAVPEPRAFALLGLMLLGVKRRRTA